MRTICALSVIALVSLVGCQRSTDSSSSQAWQELAPEGSGFSIQFPGTPSEDSGSEVTAFGVIDSAWFNLEPEGDGRSYALRYDDYPRTLVSLGDVGQLLFARQKRIEHELEAKPLNETDVFLDDYAGREILFELPDGEIGVYRIVLIDQRMYQLSVSGSQEALATSEVTTTFLDSFKLL